MATSTAATSPNVDSALPIAQYLAKWASSLRLEHLPVDVVLQLKRATRDGFGCGLFGSTLEWSRIAQKASLQQACGAGSVSVWGTSHKLPPADAALVNGIAVQGYELDDGNFVGELHGTSALLPALMAVAEHRAPISGADLLVGEAVGWEIGVRLSRCMGPMLSRGWHSPTVFGTVGAAAAVGRALRLDQERLTHAIALGALQASGLTVARVSGMGKRLCAGRAAQAGFSMALLAEAGYTGPPDVFENPAGGFCTTFGGVRPFDLEQLRRPFDDDLAARQIYFKLYASCGATHCAIDGVRTLCERHPDIKPDTVERMVARVSEHAFAHVGLPYKPKDVPAGQFSLRYTMAAALMEGNVSLDQFRPELLADPKLLGLTKRIEIIHDQSLDRSVDTRNRAQVEIELKDGTTHQMAIDAARGTPANPPSESELIAKFESLACPVLSPNQARQLANRIDELESIDDVGSLASFTIPAT